MTSSASTVDGYPLWMWNLPYPADPPSTAVGASIAFSICVSFTTVSFLIRAYTRIRIQRKIDLVDYLLFLSYCLFIAYAGMAFDWNAHRFSQQQTTIRDVKFYLVRIYAHSIMYDVTLPLVKVAILLQLLQIFVPLKRSGCLYLSFHGLIWINIIKSVACVFVLIFQCRPIEKALNPLLHLDQSRGSCVDIVMFYTISSAINVAIDLAMFILPQKIIWQLNTTTKRKVGVSGLFAIGTVACAASVMRLYYSIDALSTFATHLLRASDNIGTWLGVEIASGIAVASLPVLPRFITHVAQGSVGTFFRSFYSSMRSYASRKSESVIPTEKTGDSLSSSASQRHHASGGFSKFPAGYQDNEMGREEWFAACTPGIGDNQPMNELNQIDYREVSTLRDRYSDSRIKSPGMMV